MRLHFYIARRFLRAFMIVLGVLTVIYLLLDMMEHIRLFGAGSLGLLDLLHLGLLNMPVWIYQILPMITILATLLMVLGLARSSELVAIRAAGRSALVTLLSPVIVAFVLGVLALAALNPIAAASSKQYALLSARLGGASSSAFSISTEGLWLRQGDQTGQTVIRALHSDTDGTTLSGVTFFAFDASGLPVSRIEAASATLEPGRWALSDAKIWPLSGSANPEQDALNHKAYWIASDLTLEQIRDSFGKTSSISVWELPGFIDRLEGAGFSSRRHQVWLNMELAMPLFLVAMLMIAAGLTMRHSRFGNTAVMVLITVLLGFGVYFIRNFAQILGENGQIPVLVAAWTPPVAAILMALGIILNLEDG